MRIASSIISWVTWGLGLISMIIVFASGYNAITYSRYGGYVSHYDYPSWVWIIFAVYFVISLAILIFREMAVSVDNGKIAAAILTIIFVSVVGGIFTFFANPTYKYNVGKYHGTRTGQSFSTSTTHSQYEARLKTNEKLYKEGYITKKQYDDKVTELTKEENKKLTTNELQARLTKMKEMVKEGYITEEEYEKRRAELLDNNK